MQVIQTIAHVGPDGMLHLAVPVEGKDQDVRVRVEVEAAVGSEADSDCSIDPWAQSRVRLEAAGLRVPPPGIVNLGPVEPIGLAGITASELLIHDRR